MPGGLRLTGAGSPPHRCGLDALGVSGMPQEYPVESCERQHNANVDKEPLPEGALQKIEIHPDDQGGHCQDVNNSY